MTAEPWGAQLPPPPPVGPAAERLARALADAIAADDLPPCAGVMLGSPDHWFAASRRDRLEGVRQCREACALLDHCADAAHEAPPAFGVLGGHDYSPHDARVRSRHRGTGGRA